MFTGMNVLRNKAIRQHNLPADFQFSQAYLFFYDQLEKANLFLQAIIDTYKLPMDSKEVEWLFKNPIGDGGQFTGVANLIDKYGLMPAEAMPETFNTNNTSSISNLMSLKLREDGLQLREMAAQKGMTPEKLQAKKTEMLGTIYRPPLSSPVSRKTPRARLSPPRPIPPSRSTKSLPRPISPNTTWS